MTDKRSLSPSKAVYDLFDAVVFSTNNPTFFFYYKYNVMLYYMGDKTLIRKSMSIFILVVEATRSTIYSVTEVVMMLDGETLNTLYILPIYTLIVPRKCIINS